MTSNLASARRRSARSLDCSSGRSAELRRGFTMVELMVAITAAMVVCAGAYTLARTSLDVFQQEARMNAAQFSNVMGMNRLTTDIKRAGYMMTPDAVGDPNVCAKPTSLPLTELLFAVNVQEGDPTSAAYSGATIPAPNLPPAVVDAANNRNPDRLRVAGNYAIAERFKLGNVDADPTSQLINIEVDQLAVQRIFRDSLSGGPGFCSYFPNNGLARLVDNAGLTRYIEIVGCAPTTNGDGSNYATLQLTAASMPTGPGCGELSGGYINPINIIDYAAMNLTQAEALAEGMGTQLAALMTQDAAIAGVVGDASRMELVRRQLKADGSIRTAEIVADYVVDLNFQGRVANTPLTPHVLTTVPFTGQIGTQPQNRIRQLGVRLSTRARNPDRMVAPNPGPDKDTPLTLFRVFPTAATQRLAWARVRTFYSDVNITNLNGIIPW